MNDFGRILCAVAENDFPIIKSFSFAILRFQLKKIYLVLNRQDVNCSYYCGDLLIFSAKEDDLYSSNWPSLVTGARELYIGRSSEPASFSSDRTMRRNSPHSSPGLRLHEGSSTSISTDVGTSKSSEACEPSFGGSGVYGTSTYFASRLPLATVENIIRHAPPLGVTTPGIGIQPRFPGVPPSVRPAVPSLSASFISGGTSIRPYFMATGPTDCLPGYEQASRLVFPTSPDGICPSQPAAMLPEGASSLYVAPIRSMLVPSDAVLVRPRPPAMTPGNIVPTLVPGQTHFHDATAATCTVSDVIASSSSGSSLSAELLSTSSIASYGCGQLPPTVLFPPSPLTFSVPPPPHPDQSAAVQQPHIRNDSPSGTGSVPLLHAAGHYSSDLVSPVVSAELGHPESVANASTGVVFGADFFAMPSLISTTNLHPSAVMSPSLVPPSHNISGGSSSIGPPTVADEDTDVAVSCGGGGGVTCNLCGQLLPATVMPAAHRLVYPPAAAVWPPQSPHMFPIYHHRPMGHFTVTTNNLVTHCQLGGGGQPTLRPLLPPPVPFRLPNGFSPDLIYQGSYTQATTGAGYRQPPTLSSPIMPGIPIGQMFVHMQRSARPVTCSNCGGFGHNHNDCKEPTIGNILAAGNNTFSDLFDIFSI